MSACCFKCGHEIVELLDGDPARDSEYWLYAPAFVLDVVAGGLDVPCRAAVVCWTCMREIRPDAWESDESWDALSPVVPYEKLPTLNHDADNCWDVAAYAEVPVPVRP